MNLNDLSTHENEKGVTLVEVIVSTLILSFVLLATGYMFVLGRNNINSYGDERTALTVAVREMEDLKRLPYYHPWLIEGTHESEAGLVVIDDRGSVADGDDIKACLRWIIRDIDDDSNGIETGDYRFFTVEIFNSEDNVTCNFRNAENRILFLNSIIAP